MNIEFIPKSAEASVATTAPQPAGNYTPKWYKDLKPFENGMEFVESPQGVPRVTAKKCMPFSDSFQTGYILETWCDLYIERKDGNVHYTYSSKPDLCDIRYSSHIEIPKWFYPIEFTWYTPWAPKLPKGYSYLVTHPINHDYLPFKTLSAVVDADGFHHNGAGNHSFFVYKDFEGFIPKGTPMWQLVPFKRDNWKSTVPEFDPKFEHTKHITSSNFYGHYQKNFWHKKKFQ